MPKRLCCTQTGKLAFIDYDDPALEPGQVRIQNEFGAAKHGTEMSFYKGYAAPRGRFDDKLKIFDGNAAAPPHCAHPLGNMHVGRVVEEERPHAVQHRATAAEPPAVDVM